MHFNWVHENPNGGTKCNYVGCNCRRFITRRSFAWEGWQATQPVNDNKSTFSSWRHVLAGHGTAMKKAYIASDFMIDDIIRIRAGRGADFIVTGISGGELFVRLFGRHHEPTYTSFRVHPRNVLGFKDEVPGELKKTQD